MLEQLQFHGRGVVITGGAAGIGKSTAEILARLGAHVFVVDMDRTNVEAVERALLSEGYLCTGIVMDVTDENQVAELADLISRQGVMLKALINNVGANLKKPTTDLSITDWNKYLTLNLTSGFMVTHTLLPMLLEAPHGGAIVNISSTWALIGGANKLSYSAGKAGMLGMTRQLAADYAHAGLRVNAVCPGLTLTERIKERGVGEGEAMGSQLLGGRFADPSEVGNVIAFLASDAASYITGTTVAVDGGQTIFRN